jgi:ParB/RepB/Spo0J family partition protein
MATAKITLSASRDIPFNKLMLSQSNVRRVKAGVSIEELAEDITRRSLLQSLSVRPVVDGDGQETGMFEVPAGGRRFRALELLVRQKRMNKTQPVPCVVRTDGLAEEDSLAENVQRVALHPLDQFRAFQTLRLKGLSEAEIAARFFVSPAVVKQRLRLAAVSETLLDVYADDGMTLEQLMAFTVTNDHVRQEQIWKQLARSPIKEPYYIRRQLTEGAVRAADKRAQFVGVASYEAAGGAVMRDLFEHDDGGWLQDLLDRLVIEKLQAKAETLRVEGWKWIAVAPASLSVNAVHEPWNRSPRRLAHADTVARAVNLDMAAAGWTPTVDNYLGRVPKARILEAVREAKGAGSAQLIDHLKKPEMAKEAERLLAGTRWVPEPLRTPDADRTEPDIQVEGDAEGLPAFLGEGDSEDADDQAASDPEEPQQHPVAAE